MFVDLPDETACLFDRIFSIDDRSGNGDAFYTCFHQWCNIFKLDPSDGKDRNFKASFSALFHDFSIPFQPQHRTQVLFGLGVAVGAQAYVRSSFPICFQDIFERVGCCPTRKRSSFPFSMIRCQASETGMSFLPKWTQ